MNIMNYKEVIKNQIYCLLNIFRLSTSNQMKNNQLQMIQKEIYNAFNQIKQYIPEFNIEE